MPLNLDPSVTRKTFGRVLIGMRWHQGLLQQQFSEKFEDYEGRRFLRGGTHEVWEDVPGEMPLPKPTEPPAPRFEYLTEQIQPGVFVDPGDGPARMLVLAANPDALFVHPDDRDPIDSTTP